MKHRDILEIKKRLKKDHCTISVMRGCYVNSEKNIVAQYRETFLNMEESEFFKYLEIAKKVLSGTLGNNLLELEFKKNDGEGSVSQAGLLQLKSSGLRDDGLVDSFYQSIISSYQCKENYLILLFADAYDVMSRTSDNLKLDESEETYEYMLCAICPVSLSDPGLHYNEEEQRMRAHHRDWMVEPPVQGFLYPAFTDRSSDVNSVLYYTKNPREPHGELMEEVLGCQPIKTTQMQKETIQSLFQEAVGYEEDKAESLFIEFQENLNELVEEQQAQEGDEEPILLTSANIVDILSQSHASEEVLNKIDEVYGNYFGEDLPQADRIVDNKVLKSAQQRKKEQALEKQVENLKSMLEQANISITDDQAENAEPIAEASVSAQVFDVLLQVKPEKVSQITSQIIDGQKCIVIPLAEHETATVNGQSGLI